MSLRTILITGTSQRLGLFLTDQFLQADWRVVALTRRTSLALESLSDDRLIVYELGEYREANIENTIHLIRKKIDRLDAMVHNASIYQKDSEYHHNLTGFYENLFNIHMALPAQLNYGLVDLLSNEQRPGNIIHITDVYANNPNQNYALYCSTKAGLENLSQGFAKKFAPGVRVNTIQPGPIQFLDAHSEEDKQAVLSDTLLSYEGGFLPIYQAVCSVIDNAYITGSAIKVDGGRTLGRG